MLTFCALHLLCPFVKLGSVTQEIGLLLFFSCLSVTIHFLFVLFQALTIDPCNRAVQDQLRILKEKERKHDEHLSRALGAMFGRKV